MGPWRKSLYSLTVYWNVSEISYKCHFYGFPAIEWSTESSFSGTIRIPIFDNSKLKNYQSNHLASALLV